MTILQYRFLPLYSAVLLLAALSVQAAPISYTDLASWQAATSSTTAISFAGLVPAGGLVTYNNSTGLVLSGVQFLGFNSPTAYLLQLFGQNHISPYYNFGVPATLLTPVYDRAQSATFIPYIHVILPSNTTAFATNLATTSPNGLSFQVSLSDGSTFVAPTPAARPDMGFIGITSDSPISYIDFTVLNSAYNGGTYGLLANVQIGTTGDTVPVDPGQVPEAGTLLLIGVGLAFIGTKLKTRAMHAFAA